MHLRLCILLSCLSLNLQLRGMGVEEALNSADGFFRKGETCFRDSNWIEALEYYNKMISVYKMYPDKNPEIFARGFSSAGNICQVGEQYIQALDFYILGLEASEKAKDEALYSRCLGNIGNIYLLFKDYETALFYYNKGYDRSLIKKDIETQTAFLCNMITSFCNLRQPDKAKECYRKLMTLPVKDPAMYTFYNLINQAQIAQAEENYPAAVYFHNQALDYACRRVIDERFVTSEYIELSKVYRQKGEIGPAIKCLKKGEEIAVRRGYTVQVAECYKLLSQLYGQHSNDSLAGYYRALYVSYSDSIDQREYNKVKNKLAKFEEQQNNSYIGKLSGQINMQRWVIVFVSVCFLAVLLSIIYIFRQNKMLQRAYQTLFNRNSELIDTDEKYRQVQLKYLSLQEQLKKLQQMENKDKEPEDLSDKKLPVTLDPEYTEKLLEEILKVMEDGQTIFNSDFSLNQLSKQVNSNTKYVSWVINDTYNKNFRTFLNEYRIREASKRLLNTEKYGSLTIQGISEGVGFKSVTNFVLSFKKNVGITPSLYQKMARKEVSEE